MPERRGLCSVAPCRDFPFKFIPSWTTPGAKAAEHGSQGGLPASSASCARGPTQHQPNRSGAPHGNHLTPGYHTNLLQLRAGNGKHLVSNKRSRSAKRRSASLSPLPAQTRKLAIQPPTREMCRGTRSPASRQRRLYTQSTLKPAVAECYSTSSNLSRVQHFMNGKDPRATAHSSPAESAASAATPTHTASPA